MTISTLAVSGIAALLIIVALLKGSNGFRARAVRGNVSVGSVRGSVRQIYTGAQNGPKSSERAASPDRVAWAIGIAGVLVMVAQLVYDFLKHG